ncbi:RluA family pseudouridine synthase [Bosea sp. SSUT16]|jgi:23S rRNA pseudouridine955/2504/2580 synthase|uniref:Ribosomal large subunit pseudouridine synthase D n=1 Tax=Bosea spartocytisi TaxID=2773451 RepID=A0A927EAF8_9HYPH|nr:RluA family pseudouridine synthase [Bosea spartocytisi]MBD3846350.1 RluA family pseudouridine synthase [Bosea spartocytisi]MCT4471896.1 RluA family pseudouridine synthase [Bosea spartocytisi]
MKSGGKGAGGGRGGRPGAGSAKGKRPSHDARRRAAARPKPEGGEPMARASRPAAKPEAPKRTRAEVKAETAQVLSTGVQQLVVTPDENEMRIDRFLETRFPQLSFSHIQRIVRKGELRVDGKRADSKDRLSEGQTVRIPPLKLEQQAERPRSAKADADTIGFLHSITLYEDDDVMVLNKPAGLAVQGGSGTTRHVDGMLAALTDKDGQKPRLVHRLDKDTAGCLVIAKSRFAAATLAKTFRSRSARKVYWALVAGVPRVKQGRISTYLAREEAYDGDQRMAVAKHGEDGAMHAVTYYAIVETAAQKLGWLSLKPVTGRTHQLRAHAAHIGHPIVGDPKYFNIQNWELPGGIQNKLHLLARRIVLPHPRGKGTIDVSAPLPPHMRQSWNLLGFDDAPYDPIVEAPDE